MPITEKTPIWLDLKKEYIDDNFAKLRSYLRVVKTLFMLLPSSCFVNA